MKWSVPVQQGIKSWAAVSMWQASSSGEAWNCLGVSYSNDLPMFLV